MLPVRERACLRVRKRGMEKNSRKHGRTFEMERACMCEREREREREGEAEGKYSDVLMS